jgi:hypothetical protein
MESAVYSNRHGSFCPLFWIAAGWTGCDRHNHFSVAIGSVVSIALPQCQSFVNRILMRQVHMKMNGLSR